MIKGSRAFGSGKKGVDPRFKGNSRFTAVSFWQPSPRPESGSGASKARECGLFRLGSAKGGDSRKFTAEKEAKKKLCGRGYALIFTAEQGALFRPSRVRAREKFVAVRPLSTGLAHGIKGGVIPRRVRVNAGHGYRLHVLSALEEIGGKRAGLVSPGNSEN